MMKKIMIYFEYFGITPQFSRTLVISEALTEMVDSINDFVDKFN